MKSKIRISDVATHAGVSRATVSAVVNNRVGESIRVSEDTQTRVWESVRALGYIANPVAKSLAGGQNNLIGIFTFEPIFPLEHRNFYYPFLIGIENGAELSNHDLLLFTSKAKSDSQRSIYVDGVNRLQLADGAILLGLHEQRDELKQLLEEDFPFIYIGRRELDAEHQLSYISADYQSATADIVDYIAQFNHKKVAYLGTNHQREAVIDRKAGYTLGLKRNGLVDNKELRFLKESLILDHSWLKARLEEGITAFVVENDELGLALYHLSKREGYEIPNDFSFAVLGDPLLPRDEPIDWTSFEIPRVEMGVLAVEMLIKKISDKSRKPVQRTLTCQFKTGNTVGYHSESR